MYAIAIARGHIFNDGNKRTALAGALSYLREAGISIERNARIEDLMVDVAQGLVTLNELACMLRSISR